MAYTPISGTVPQLSKNAAGAAAGAYYLKGYASGTSTPLSMGTDSTPAATLAKCKLNTRGEPISNDADETTVFIPHFNASYKLVLYLNSTDADANTTANALWVVDNISGSFDASAIAYNANSTIKQFLDNSFVDSYTTLRGLTSLELTDGDQISLTDDGISGEFVVKTGTVTDNGGTLIVFTDDSNRYAERPEIHQESFYAAHFGFLTSNTAADNDTALQAAIDAAANTGSQVIMPGGTFLMNNVTLPNNVALVGQGTGFASNKKTRLSCTATSGVAITFEGFYTHLEKFSMEYTGASMASVTGIDYGPTTRTFLRDVEIFGFGVGITNAKVPSTFTHLHDNVYIKGNTVGIDIAFFNNAVFTGCFIESNGTNGIFDTFANLIFDGGCVLELFGDERLAETNTSVNFVVKNGFGFTCRDYYTEIATLGAAGTSEQFATIWNTKGITIEGGYWNRSAENQQPMIEFMDSNCSAVSVKQNYFLRGPSSGTDYFCNGSTDHEDFNLSGVSGTFVVGETITGGTSSETAVVANVRTGQLSVTTISGAFTATETITGGTSAATATFDSNTTLTDITYSFDIANNAVKSTMLEKEIEFTPELFESGVAVSGITYGTQEGTITLSGNQCTINVNIVLTAVTGGANAITIPIPVKSFPSLGSGGEHFGLLGALNMSGSFVGYLSKIESGVQTIDLLRDFSTTLKGNNLTATSQIKMQLSFPLDRQAI